MAARDEGTAPEPVKPGRKKVSLLRNLIAVLLLISLSAVAYREWDAHRQSSVAIHKLNQAMANEEGDLLSIQQVERLIGRGPDAPGVAEGQELKFTYTWRGVFRKYPLIAVYTRKSEPALLRIE
jgi:hypothetical protein